MLAELSIQDFAIIDKTSVTFQEGLTVLTGETGAGKSIIIDAIQLLAGGRGSVEFVRHGAKKAEIEGLFLIDRDDHPIYEAGSAYGVEISDGMAVLQRTITSGGKSICRVNGKLVTLAILREFGKTLIDIHSQHETQSLMEPDNHIELLDAFRPEQISVAKEEYRKLYERLTELKLRYKSWSKNEQEMSHRQDLLAFQKKELEQAELQPNEDVELENERNRLANFEKVHKSLQTAYNALYGEQRGIEWVRIAEQALQEQQDADEFISQKAEALSNAYYAIEELSYDIRNYSDQMQYDEGRLNDIEARLDEISRLKRKYGSTVNEMLEYLAKVEEELEQITNKDVHLNELENEIRELTHDAFLEAKHLHEIRSAAAAELMVAIHEELQGLYLEKAKFVIRFNPEWHDTDAQILEALQTGSARLNANGFDQVQFLISANPGEPPKELNKVASGGELSRIMLALKNIFARHQGVTSVIFDEVDTGVSGRVAQAIAEKIFEISKASQVLCITHLPQVAAMSDTHKLISKTQTDERTETSVRELNTDEKIDELSRMITGASLTDTAKIHAKEMLELANHFKLKTAES
ncbi:DNA repair protein RecN [Aciduricibacillus chroicocephali]|uniref:DNA repair protein RecN n=1 Tax=Aciduricibacillus chroicocephali TaxID=3054939 RepID=A0ABY9KRJ8_9BACI|nr:DNA repair protein RecN [Bacillaceae bacterium 44XB]